MKVIHLEKEYMCIFCDFCRIPCAGQINACEICQSIFHPWCALHRNHKCVSCFGCIRMECPVFQRLKQYSHKKLENHQESLLDTYLSIKDVVHSYDNVMKILAQKYENKDFLKQIEKVVENQLVYCKNIQRIDQNKMHCLLLTESCNIDIFTDKIYHVVKCSGCGSFFHSESRETTLCQSCVFCHGCNSSLEYSDAKGFVLYPHMKFNKTPSIIESTYKAFCQDCFQNYVLHHKYCPSCLLIWDEDAMIECDSCLRWFHTNGKCSPKNLDDISKVANMVFECDLCTSLRKFFSVGNVTNNSSDLDIPLCYYCQRYSSHGPNSLSQMIVICQHPYTIAHKSCAFSAIKDIDLSDKSATLDVRRNNTCMDCGEGNATIKCMFCRDRYFHLACAFQKKNQLFVSNYPILLCEKHHEKKELFSKYITLFMMIDKFSMDPSSFDKKLQITRSNKSAVRNPIQKEYYVNNRFRDHLTPDSGHNLGSYRSISCVDNVLYHHSKFDSGLGSSTCQSLVCFSDENEFVLKNSDFKKHYLEDHRERTSTDSYKKEASDDNGSAKHQNATPYREFSVDRLSNSKKKFKNEGKNSFEKKDPYTPKIKISKILERITDLDFLEMLHAKIQTLITESPKRGEIKKMTSLRLNKSRSDSGKTYHHRPDDHETISKHLKAFIVSEKRAVSLLANSYMQEFQKENLPSIECNCILQVKNFVFLDQQRFKCYLIGQNSSLDVIGFDSKYTSYNGTTLLPHIIESQHLKRYKNLKLIQIFLTAQGFLTRLFGHISMYRYNPCLPLSVQANNYSLTHNYYICQSNSGFYLAQSKIHGKGLFASRFYYPKELVIVYEGETVDSAECDKRENQYVRLGGDLYFFNIDDTVFVDSTILGNFAKFINQSCDPNCFASHMRIGAMNCVVISTLRFVAADEEFTYKYGAQKNEVECRCGAPNCLGSL